MIEKPDIVYGDKDVLDKDEFKDGKCRVVLMVDISTSDLFKKESELLGVTYKELMNTVLNRSVKNISVKET